MGNAAQTTKRIKAMMTKMASSLPRTLNP